MFENLNVHILQPIRSFKRAARLFLLMLVIDGIMLSAWQLFFNFYILQKGFNLDFLGLVNSLPSAAGLIFGIPLGRLSDRIGRKASLVIGLAATSLSMLAQVTFPQPAVIIAASFLYGMFNMLFIISQAPLMVKLSEADNRTMLFSLSFGLQTVSGAVGSILAGVLPGVFGAFLRVAATSATAYQAVLVVGILLGASALIPLWVMREPSSSAPAVPDNSAGRQPAGLTRLMLKMLTPQILVGFGAAILIPYMNVFFKVRFQISDSLLGILFSLSSLMIGIGTLVGPRLATRLGGKIHAVVATQFGSLAFLLLMGFAPTLALSAVGYLMRSVLMNMSAPLFSAFCMERTPEHQQGYVNSILNLSWNVGWAIGPFISGVVQQAYGFPPLFIATAVLYFSAIVAQWIFFVRDDSTKLPSLPVIQRPE